MKPILFSAPMVIALLAGRKTQTRRILKPQPQLASWAANLIIAPDDRIPGTGKPGQIIQTSKDFKHIHGTGAKVHLGLTQDKLWVKETWRTYKSLDHCRPVSLATGAPIGYEADGRTNINNHQAGPLLTPGKIRQSIFMRRWMSRITLTITGVRIERLHDITEENAIAEGIEPFETDGFTFWKNYLHDPKDPDQNIFAFRDPLSSFHSLWVSINGPDSWESNPLVAAYAFDLN